MEDRASRLGVVGYFDALDELQNKLSIIVEKYNHAAMSVADYCECTNGKSAENELLDSIDEDLKSVNAFLKIAAAHTEKRVVHRKAAEFDKAKLLSLQVQIDPHSHEDDIAAELYFESYAQLNWLNEKRKSILNECEKKLALEQKQKEERANRANKVLDEIVEEYINQIRSPLFEDLLRAYADFSKQPNTSSEVLLGHVYASLPIPKDSKCERIETALRGIRSEAFDIDSYSILVPIIINMQQGASMLFAEDDLCDDLISSEIINFVCAALYNLANLGSLENVSYIDPTTFSPLPLGDLAVLAQYKDSVINHIPQSFGELKQYITYLESKTQEFDARVLSNRTPNAVSDVFIFRDYPDAYDASTLALIRRLVGMANKYQVIVILLSKNKGEREKCKEDLYCQTANQCITISTLDHQVTTELFPEIISNFRWSNMAGEVNGYIEYLCGYKKEQLDEDNKFINRVGSALAVTSDKGNRELRNLPLGIDEKGNVVTVDFEDENFAAFLCGAARSGKSTLLHTLLTGIFISKHPDDVEIWLVDFKMTEFSRYVEEPPPHIRYIVLDESPELVYDLLDRLTEIMSKRQAIFKKNGWVKLADAQRAGRYMPALLVVIDEFSVMSKIIADAAIAGKDYKDKLQMLLAKGAALGFRFIFSSQGFSQGTRGLSEYSKKQIQQRIAMKTDYLEIKETLDLPSASDTDRRLMEELVPHYALLKVLGGSISEHINRVHVLFFQDTSEQKDYLASSMRQYEASDKYEPLVQSSYIDKMVQMFDGNELKEYVSAQPEIDLTIQRLRDSSFDESALFAIVGQPLRMKACSPIEIVNGYAENLLFISPVSKSEIIQSVLTTLLLSLKEQNVDIEILVPRNTSMLPKTIDAFANVTVRYGISGLKAYSNEKMKPHNEPNSSASSLTIILNPEVLLQDALNNSTIPYSNSIGNQKKTARVVFDKREQGKDDLNTLLLKGQLEVQAEVSACPQASSESTPEAAMKRCNALFGFSVESDDIVDNAESIGEEILNRMEQASRYGEHYMVIASSILEAKNTGISPNWFRHKLTFRTSQEDARVIMSRSDASVVTELASDCFRYSNGMDGVTFRPYAHSPMGILSENALDDIDEYLL